MSACFADTFFFLALLSESDNAHERAVKARDSGRRTITTDFVLLELGDNLCDRRSRLLYVEFYAFLKSDPITEALTADHHFEQAGFKAPLK